jgi:hypothetical protein
MHDSGHAAPTTTRAPSLRNLPRRYLALALIIVVICLLGTLVLVRDSAGPTPTPTVETFTPASSSLVSSLASVPASVYDTVGVASPDNPVTPLQPMGSRPGPLWTAGADGSAARPVVFFYGAEFAPYAAAERWPLVLALSRFGTFGRLGLMQSSGSTAFPDLSTYTFSEVGYSSRWVTFEQVERYSALNPTGSGYLGLETPSGPQMAAIGAGGAGTTTFALVDVANRYALSGSAYAPGVLTGLDQGQIAGDLTQPASPLTQAVLAAANEISAAICAVDGDRPAAVCHSRGVDEADLALKIAPAGA